MKILIGGTELTVKQCAANEAANGKRTLSILIPRTEIEPADLEAILDAQDGTIVLTKDDETTEIYAGYKTTYEIKMKTISGEKVYDVLIICVAEAERRALEAQLMAVQLRSEIEAVRTSSVSGASWDDIAAAIEEGVNEV